MNKCMIEYPRTKIRKQGKSLAVIEYLFNFFLIINITCIWLGYGIGSQVKVLSRAMTPLLCMAIVTLKLTPGVTVSFKLFKQIAFFTICIFSSVIAHINTIFNSSVQILFPLICFSFLAFLLSQSEFEALICRFINLMTIMAVVSLVFYFLGGVLHIIAPTGDVVYQWGRADKAASYYNLYFEPRGQWNETFFAGLRKNCGIFVEGTMYGFILDIAYMLQRMATKKRPWVCFILLITIMTTLSTAPILAIFIFEGFNMVTHRLKHRQLNVMKNLLIPVMLAVCVAVFWEVLQKKSSTGSYSVRVDHMMGCFRAFINTFPFGVGYGNSEILLGTFKYAQGLSVGIPYMLALGGGWSISNDYISGLEIYSIFSTGWKMD